MGRARFHTLHSSVGLHQQSHTKGSVEGRPNATAEECCRRRPNAFRSTLAQVSVCGRIRRGLASHHGHNYAGCSWTTVSPGQCPWSVLMDTSAADGALGFGHLSLTGNGRQHSITKHQLGDDMRVADICLPSGSIGLEIRLFGWPERGGGPRRLGSAEHHQRISMTSRR